jgi:hypothetical protein
MLVYQRVNPRFMLATSPQVNLLQNAKPEESAGLGAPGRSRSPSGPDVRPLAPRKWMKMGQLGTTTTIIMLIIYTYILTFRLRREGSLN